MNDIQQAREALQKNILAAVKGFEEQFPGFRIAHVLVLHEGFDKGPIREVEVGLTL